MSAYPAPTLLTVHTDFYGLRGEANTLFGQTIRSATWVNAVSKSTLFDTLQIVPDIMNRSSVIYNGLDAPNVSPEPLPFDKPKILYVGRLAHEKGIDLAVEAFATIQTNFPQTRLVIAGDGPARAELESQVSRLNLQNKTEFTGWISPEKVPQLINQSTVVVMPSRYREPFGLVAIEAGQMERPVVATQVGGLPEVVLHEETGLLCEKENSAELAEAIAFLLSNPNRASQMGQMGRKRALEVFSLQNFVQNYETLYTKLVEM
jgi:glycogen(starch) synthase